MRFVRQTHNCWKVAYNHISEEIHSYYNSDSDNEIFSTEEDSDLSLSSTTSSILDMSVFSTTSTNSSNMSVAQISSNEDHESDSRTVASDSRSVRSVGQDEDSQDSVIIHRDSNYHIHIIDSDNDSQSTARNVADHAGSVSFASLPVTAQSAGGVDAALNHSSEDFRDHPDPHTVDSISERPNDNASTSTVPLNQETPSNHHKQTMVSESFINTSLQDDDSSTCPICFDSWTSSGDHRICCLKCGHLFGKSCIERWIRDRNYYCPQCNSKALIRDIRVLYVKRIMAADTTERDKVLKELELEKSLRREAQFQYSIAETKLKAYQDKLRSLNSDLSTLRAQTKLISADDVSCKESVCSRPSLKHRASVQLVPTGSCRVLASSDSLRLLAVSQKSQTSSLFPAFGVRLVEYGLWRPMQFVSLHQKQVRSLCFSPSQTDLLLSASLDKTARLTVLSSNTHVSTISCQAPVWAASWGARQHQLQLGLQSGHVLEYDTRSLGAPLHSSTLGDTTAPVVGLCCVHAHQYTVVCRLHSLSVLPHHTQLGAGVETDMSQLLVEHGPLVSASMCDGHLLVSSRPSRREPHCKHAVFSAGGAGGVHEVGTVYGSRYTQSVMSQGALVTADSASSLLVCAADHASVCLWDVSTGCRCDQISCAGQPVVHVSQLPAQENLVVLLDEKRVNLYECANHSL